MKLIFISCVALLLTGCLKPIPTSETTVKFYSQEDSKIYIVPKFQDNDSNNGRYFENSCVDGEAIQISRRRNENNTIEYIRSVGINCIEIDLSHNEKLKKGMK